MNFKQSISREQISMPCPDDLIGSDNPVRVIDAFVELLDLVRFRLLIATSIASLFSICYYFIFGFMCNAMAIKRANISASTIIGLNIYVASWY